MSKRISTKFTGVFYRESSTNSKPDKTYYIVFRDENSKLQEVKIGKYSEGIREQFCNVKRNEIITKLRLGETVKLKHAKKDKITIDELSEEYFDYMLKHSRKNGIKEQQRYDNHIKPVFGSMSISEINQKIIDKFQTDKKQIYANKTVNNMTDLLGTIIEYAIKHDRVKEQNPARKIKRFDIDNERERFLSELEVKKLLADTKDDDYELYTFCLLALTTGGRVETVLNVREFDCDFGTRTVNLKDFKNNSTYKGFLTEDAILAIKTQMAKHGTIFQSGMSTIQRKVSVYLQQFNKKIKADDRKNRVVIHTLRHTFASHLAIKGTPIFTIQKLMNHADIKMTMRYAKLAPDSGRDFVEKLFS